MLEGVQLGLPPAGRLVRLPFETAAGARQDVLTIAAGSGDRTAAFKLTMRPIPYAGFVFRGIVVRATMLPTLTGAAPFTAPALEVTQVLPDGSIVAIYGPQLTWFRQTMNLVGQGSEYLVASMLRVVRDDSEFPPDLRVELSGLVRELGDNDSDEVAVVHAEAICERLFDEQVDP